MLTHINRSLGRSLRRRGLFAGFCSKNEMSTRKETSLSPKVDELESLILSETESSTDHLTPEISLRLITQNCSLWSAGADHPGLARFGGEPFWAFYWPGGQSLTRFVLDRTDSMAGKRVLDLGCGCGSSSIAAVRSGADHVIANDIDPTALVAARMNATANLSAADVSSRLSFSRENFLVANNDNSVDFDVVLIGDLLYDAAIGAALLEWLVRIGKTNPVEVLLGDPDRWFLSVASHRWGENFDRIAEFDLNPKTILENRGFSKGYVWRWRSTATSRN